MRKATALINASLVAFGCVVIVSIFIVADVYAHTDVTPTEAKDLIDTNSSLLVVDVRESSEYCDNEHILGAINLPWSSGVCEEKYQGLPVNAEILVVCYSSHRSDPAAQGLIVQPGMVQLKSLEPISTVKLPGVRLLPAIRNTHNKPVPGFGFRVY
jgi:rhodanese-related sulfurtransferase